MAEARVERRLAAILAADVAGYSRLMGIDEEGTLAALKMCRRELFDLKIAEHRGRIVKTTGDGALVEFPSAGDAIRCATDIQRAMAVRNVDIAEDRRIEFRIGINVGDIIIDEGDIYGDGVNIDARVEALAKPGAVFVSEYAYQLWVGAADFYAGNFQAAVEAADRLIRFRPDKSNAYRFKAAALGHLGRIEEANKALTKAIEISPQNFDYFVRKRPTWMRAVDHDLQIEGLKKAGLPKQ